MTEEFKLACELIEWAEDYEAKVYRCTAGKLTQGIGRNLEAHPLSDKEKNELVDGKVSLEVARRWVIEELVPIEDKLSDTVDYLKCNTIRRAILLDMAFNIGLLGLSKFKKMWEHIHKENWVEASREMKDSSWYTQVGRRGKRNVELFAKGFR